MIKSLSLHIDEMSCQHCVNKVKEVLNSIHGISDPHVEIGKADFKYDTSTVTLQKIEEAVKKAGYTPYLT